MQLRLAHVLAMRTPPRLMPLARVLLAAVLALWAAGCASLPSHVDRTASQAWAAPEQTVLGRYVASERARVRARADSAFALLDSVDTAFAARLGLVQQAQRTLDLQYYAIHADASTEVLLRQLRQAARRGVRVRVLLDDFNTTGKDAQVLRLAFEPNVQIRLFNPLPGSRASLVGRVVASLKDSSRIAKRMHNKMFIADSAVGITGGRNLGDAYFGGDGKSSFVDLDILAAGRIVRDMAASFDRYWNDELAYPVQSLVSREELERLSHLPEAQAAEPAAPASAGVTRAALPASASGATVLPNVTPAAASQAERSALDLQSLPLVWAPALLLHDQPGKIGPDDNEADAGETVVDGLLHLIGQARQDVLIVSPYFVPGPQMMQVFRALRQRGVRVRVLTNSLASNDAPAAHAGYARYRRPLLELGVELYEMRAGQEHVPGHWAGSSSGSARGAGAAGSKTGSARASLHSKAVIIDARLAVIGSMNLDLRSQRQNSEVALLVRSAAIAQQASAPILGTMRSGAYRVAWEHGRLIWHAPPGASFQDATSEPEAGFKQRLLEGLVAPFAPDEML